VKFSAALTRHRGRGFAAARVAGRAGSVRAETGCAGTGYYQQRADIRHQVRSHARAIERHRYKVTIQAINPDTGELLPTAS
jgi:hypothetical protein